MTNVLGIFAKQPQAGQVKTRLAAETSPEFAAAVAEAFLRDVLAKLQRLDGERWLVHSPADWQDQAARDAGYRLGPQGGGDLGQRIERFLRDRLEAGAERIVIVGTDSPTLRGDIVRGAFERLESADVVIGPATDGGYYLLGIARRLPPIFDGIAWGTEVVYEQTVERLRCDLATPAWRIGTLPPWCDVDTIDDWRRLPGHIAQLRRHGIDPGCPSTERLLAMDANARCSRHCGFD